ncbi:MAG: hypothetical protein C0417_03870 [Chlorobiaceae bacterium]|nr:hypothetical protein [Chlorobiaceae bacterium]
MSDTGPILTKICLNNDLSKKIIQSYCFGIYPSSSKTPQLSKSQIDMIDDECIVLTMHLIDRKLMSLVMDEKISETLSVMVSKYIQTEIADFCNKILKRNLDNFLSLLKNSRKEWSKYPSLITRRGYGGALYHFSQRISEILTSNPINPIFFNIYADVCLYFGTVAEQISSNVDLMVNHDREISGEIQLPNGRKLRWGDFIAEVRRRRIALGSMMSDTSVINYRDNTIIVSCPDAFSADIIRLNKIFLEDLLNQIFLMKISIDPVIQK